MSRPFRIDWPGIKTRIAAAGLQPAAVCLVCIPEASKQLILAGIDRLKWQATYRVADYDFSDWETLQDYIEEIENAMATDCEELVTEIVNQVTNNVTNIVNNQVTYTELCCLPEDTPVHDPPPSIEPPPATGGELDDLCIQAQAAHDNMTQKMQDMFDLAEILGGVSVSLIAFVLALVPTLVIPAALIGILIGLIVALIADELTDDAVTVFGAIKHDVVCIIVNSASAEEAYTNVQEYMDTIVGGNPSVIPLFKVFWNQKAVNDVWEGNVTNTGGYTAEYCQDCFDWSNVYGYSYRVVDWTGTVEANVRIGSWGSVPSQLYPLQPTWHQPAGDPTIISDVLEGLEAYHIGDTTFENFNTSYAAPIIPLGLRSGSGSIFASATYDQFKLLVSTAANPALKVWISATISTAQAEIPGEFEIVPGVGGTVTFTDVLLNGGGASYTKEIRVEVP